LRQSARPPQPRIPTPSQVDSARILRTRIFNCLHGLPGGRTSRAISSHETAPAGGGLFDAAGSPEADGATWPVDGSNANPPAALLRCALVGDPAGGSTGPATPPLISSRIASSTFSGSSTTSRFGATTTYPLKAVGLEGIKTVTFSSPTLSLSGLSPAPVTSPTDQMPLSCGRTATTRLPA